MSLYDINLYMEDVNLVASLDLPWNRIKNKTLVITGATGLIGSFFLDVILEKNIKNDLNCNVYALGRSIEKLQYRFSKYANDNCLHFVKYDVNEHFENNEIKKIDYVLHLASNTHPLQYSMDPIGTITTNIIGVYNMLDFSVKHNAVRFVFASSNEVYGENRGDVELFDENYCGYINCNTLRAGYPESKRCGEALCQAYLSKNGLDVVIPRLTRSYGPTMLMSDSKAISQFVKKSIAGEDIILKSKGNQYYSYQYVADSVSGLFYVLLCGEKGQAYNIADESSDIMMKDLARILADINGKNVIFEVPDAVEAAGYSKATKARLDGSRLKSLGWKPRYNIKQGLERTISILKSLEYDIN